MTYDLSAILAPHAPPDVLTEILAQHRRSHLRFGVGDFEGSLEAFGKFAESAIRLNEHLVLGCHTPLTKKLDAFDKVVERIVASSGSAGVPEGLRVLAPRVLLAAYTIRNKRRGGHVSGEVNPNAWTRY